MRVVRVCSIGGAVLVLGMMGAAPVLAAGYGTTAAATTTTKPATTSTKTTVATTASTAAKTASAATTASLPKTGVGPLPMAAGVALLLGGAGVLLWDRRRAA